MAYIDTDYVDEVGGGSALRQAWFTDSGTYSPAAFTEVAETATELVDSALAEVGYPTGIVSPPRLVQMVTFGAFVQVASARKMLWTSLPEAYRLYVELWEKLRKGELRIPSLTQDQVDGVGGFVFTDSDASISGAAFQVFNPRTNLSGY
jgi:hypothetical protein